MTTERPHPHLSVRHEGPVLRVALTRPDQRNAQVPSLWKALAEVADGLDPTVRVVVLTGEGASFSAGLDRSMLVPGGSGDEPDILAQATGGAGTVEETIAGFQRGFTAWAEVPAVVVAAVQGHAIGAGFQLALSADIRILADDAQLAMRETSLGLVPDLGGTGPLVRAVGYSRALEICATGRFVGAQEAVTLGLASMAVPAEKLTGATEQAVQALLAAPEAALRELKPLLRGAQTLGVEDQLRAEREAQARLLAALAAGSAPA